MNKKGAELPLNTVIIIVLVVIVLLVVAFFFLGGTSNLSKSVRSIFFGATAGTDLSLAREICEQRCQAAASVPTGGRTAYCDTPFYLDLDNDGKAEVGTENKPISHYCNPSGGTSEINVQCQYGDCSEGGKWKKF
ncbi:MAG: hypothetical protein AABX90_01830 [Nanoarchaeota archaeon]